MFDRRDSHALTPGYRSRRQRARGFTLVEMMISVTIIALMAAALVPTFSEMQADDRQSAAAADIVSLARTARGRAISTGVAHMLRFRDGSEAGGVQLGSIQLWMGMNNRCQLTPWNDALTDTTGTLAPLELFSMVSYNEWDDTASAHFTDDDQYVMFLRARRLSDADTAFRSEIRICYQPNGVTYASDADPIGDLSRQVSTYAFLVFRRLGPTGTAPRGVTRELLFAPGALPRSR